MRLRWAAVLVLSAVGAPAVALELPRPFSATYIGRPYVVGKLETVITLERAGEYLKYTLRGDASAPFYRNEFYECSVMQVRGERLYALEYKHTDKKNPDKNLTGRFDWTTNTATITSADGTETRTTGLVWPVWDPLSLQVGIMTDLTNGAFGAEKVYRLLDRRGVTDRTFRKDGEETITTQTASMKSVRISRADRPGDRLWFAPEHNYAPVRIELKNFDIELTSDLSGVSRSPARGQAPPTC